MVGEVERAGEQVAGTTVDLILAVCAGAAGDLAGRGRGVVVLEKHQAVARVNYTGLSSHPDHGLAMKQMKHPGGMLSFELKKGLHGGIDFMNKLKMCIRTVSLGTCDTLLSHPASMSHHGVPKDQREKYGITDGLIRMNVGIENAQDIIADLNQALR